MAIITVSRGSYSKGKEVAEGVAARLDYDCISRGLILEASDRFNIPEIQLRRAIEDPPSFLERFTHGKLEYIVYIKCALTEHARRDNLVYHGYAGHVLLTGIPHVLKVRIIAEMSTRIAVMMKRTDVPDEREARNLIDKIDEGRRKWTRRLYGVDPFDPALYDLVIHIDKIDVAGAVDLICQAASQDPFATTEAAQRTTDDQALACRVKAALLKLDPNVLVTSEFGNVLVHTKADERRIKQLDERAGKLAGELEGIHNIEVRVGESVPPGAV